jgi:hypothetical protein
LDSNIARVAPNSTKDPAATPKTPTKHWGYLRIPIRKKYVCRMIYLERDRGEFDLRSLQHTRAVLVMTP